MVNSNRIQKIYFHLMIQNFIELIQEALDISENVYLGYSGKSFRMANSLQPAPILQPKRKTPKEEIDKEMYNKVQ